MPAAANTYRVVKVPDSLLIAMRTARDQSKTTNAHFLADAVNVHLPGLVAELQRLGFGTRGESLRAARLPFSDECGTIGQLKDASENVGLPATKLLELCLTAAVRPPEEPKRRRGRKPKLAETAEKKSRRPQRQRRADTVEEE
jgi:hypothetical protein